MIMERRKGDKNRKARIVRQAALNATHAGTFVEALRRNAEQLHDNLLDQRIDELRVAWRRMRDRVADLEERSK